MTYDEAKRQTNLTKHGIDLADCCAVFDAPIATQAAASTVEDSDNPITTEADWNHAIVSCSMEDLNQQLNKRRTRGQQKKPTKKPTTIRFDEDVLSDLKSLGKGWQTQVNSAMREWIKAHKNDSLAH